MLSNKTPHGKEEAKKYYVGYVEVTGVRPLHVIIKKIKLCTNHMSVLANHNVLLEYIEIKALFDKKFNKKGFYTKSIYDGCMNTKISSYNGNFHDNKRLTKNKYYGHSTILLESIFDVKKKFKCHTFLDEFFERNSVERPKKESSFKESAKFIAWSDDDQSSDKS